MTRQHFILGAILMCTVFPSAASAQVINEILYDLQEGSDGGREWIEVVNTGTSTINLSKWKLFENGTNHGIKAMGIAEVPPGAYAVIADNPAKFSADHPAYAGLLFDSAFSLSNDGEKLVLKNETLHTVDTVSYTGKKAHGDGNSLQRTSDGKLVPGRPTPGAPNTFEAIAAPAAVKPSKTSAREGVSKTLTEHTVSPKESTIHPESPSSDSSKEPIEKEPVPKALTQTAAVSASGVPQFLWYGGMAALLLFGAGALVAARRLETVPVAVETSPPNALSHQSDFDIEEIDEDIK